MARLLMHNQHPSPKVAPGFSVVEMSATLAILLITTTFAVVTFTSVIRDTRFKEEVAKVDSLIRKTMSSCLERGSTGRVILGIAADETDNTVTDNTIRGFYIDDTDTLVELYRVQLENASFTRTNEIASPWLGNTEKGLPSSFVDNTVLVTATGMVEGSGTIYMQYGKSEAVLEVLANGSVDTFYYGGVDKGGADIWTR